MLMRLHIAARTLTIKLGLIAALCTTLLVIGPCQPATFAGEKARFLTVVKVFCGGFTGPVKEELEMTSTGARENYLSLRGSSAVGEISGRIRANQISVRLDRPKLTETKGHLDVVPRDGPFYLDERDPAVKYVADTCRKVFPGRQLKGERYGVTASQAKARYAELNYDWRELQVRCHFILSGYIFLDRFYGVAVGFEDQYRLLFSYWEALKSPPVGPVRVGDFPSGQILKRAAAILKVPKETLELRGLGWAANEGQVAILCYQIVRPGEIGPYTYHGSPTITLYLRANNLIELKRTES